MKNPYPAFILLLCALSFGFGKKSLTVAVNMLPDELDYFTNDIVAGFNRANKCDIQVMNYTDNAALPAYFDGLPKRPDNNTYPPLGLCMIPHERTRSLLKAGKLMALNSLVPPVKIAEIKDNFFLAEMFETDGKLFLVPRKLETRLLVFRQDKVRDALTNWAAMRPAVDSVLKTENGAGLPRDYLLEVSPDLWDFYDLFTAGYYWKHAADNPAGAGRIAQRGKRYHGTVTGLMDQVFQCGGTEASILDFKSGPATDAFAWECLMIKHGLYNPAMWEKGWSGTDIWKAFRDNEAYLSYMTQIDCFSLSVGEKGKPPCIAPENMGIAVMPQGCSIELSDSGDALRRGRHAVSTGGWWWGIPADAPEAELAFRFLEYLTGAEVQKKECGRFGLIPVRIDLMMDPPDFFKSGAMQQVFELSKYQLTNNSINSVPVVRDYGALEGVYLDAWYGWCIGLHHGKTGLPPVRSKEVREALVKGYQERLSGIR